jgi:hypothetical protein
MFQDRHAQSTAKYRKGKSRRLIYRAFGLIIGASLTAIAFAPGNLLRWKQIVPSARAQSDKSPKVVAPADSPLATQQIDQNPQLSAQAVDQIVALEAEKLSRTPAQQKIDSRLLQAVRESRGQKMASGVNLAPVNVGVDTNDGLKVDIAADVSDDLITRIEALGGKIIIPSWKYHTIRAQVSLADIETIAGYAQVKFIQPAVGSTTNRVESPRPTGGAPIVISASPESSWPKPRAAFVERAAFVRGKLIKALAASAQPMMPTGTVNSEGDRTHRADDTRNTYGYAGQGIRIAVLSDSYDNQSGAAADVASGNLPGPGNPLGNTTAVTVVQDNPSGGTDEGRAMLQIVHDIAPKAQLFFATANGGPANFASNILALRNAPNNCDIIIDDVFYFSESPFQDGIIAQAVNTVTAGGALYFSSAGNQGNLAKSTAGYFEGDFNDAGSPAFTFPGGAKTGTIHNFGTVGSPVNGDIITAATNNGYLLNWSDPIGASNNDYDLFVVSSTNTVKASSTNIQSGTQDPVEFIAPLSLAAGDRLVVFKTAAAAVRAFAINTLGGVLTVKTTGQTFGHSAAVNAFSVGATPAAASGGASPAGPFPGAFTGANQVEVFTSDGPRRVFYNANGTPITPGNFLFGTSGGALRNKPDITAADGVMTTFPSTSGLNPFYGTSAAAPHAGAIAGLLKSANNSLTPAQIRTILTTTTVDIELPGFDNVSGLGIVQAFQAMQAVSPTPQATLLLGTVTQAEGSFNNGNGSVDPGEVGNLTIQLTNPSLVNATSVNAVLSTSTPGITLNQASASYGTINAGANASNASPFVFGVSSSVPCGTTINFTLTVSFSGGSSPQILLFSTVIGKQAGPISSTLGAVPPAPSGVTSVTGTQTGRLTRNATASTCAAPKVAPGLAATTGARAFDAYTFTNNNAVAQCVTVTLTANFGINMYSATYNNAGFVSATPNTNFLADPGESGAVESYSFMAPAGQSFTVVVHEVNPGGAVGSPYTLTVSLANCVAAPVCTPITVNPPAIPSAFFGSLYSQPFSAVGGSGTYNFALSGALPTGLNFTGSTLSGTPTQLGSFPITVTATDVAGCAPGSRGYTLNVAKGNQLITVGTHAPASATFNTGFTVAATASSGLPVSYSSAGSCTNVGATFTMTSGTGTCSVKYDQPGDSNYNAAPQVTESVTAQKANQTVTVSTHAPASATFNTNFTVAATASSGLAVVYSSAGLCTNVGATFTMTSGTGTCTVMYNQPGDSNYNAAPQVTESVTAQKASQTITFGGLANKNFGDPDFTVSATASSLLTVSFTATGNCTISTNTVHLTGAGSCTITAKQAGDTNYNAAADVPQSFTIAKAATTTALISSANPSNLAQNVTFTATVSGPAGTGTPTGTVTFRDGGTPISCTNAGGQTLNAGGVGTCQTTALTAGSHVITADYSGDTNFAISSGTLAPNQVVNNRPLVSFSAATYPVNESDGVVHVIVNRTGDTSVAFNVDYATDDTGASTDCSQLNTGLASARCDFNTALGTLRFAANQTQATIDIPITQDSYTEGPESFTVNLSNVTGGAFLISPATATITINDSTPPAGTTNAIDDTTTFVRQQYHDFLNREPDAAGLLFWKNNIDICNQPGGSAGFSSVAACIEFKRITTSAAFFLSIEFMQTGTFVRSFYVAGLNRPNPPSATDATANMPAFTEWLRDTQAVQRGVIVGQGNWQATLDANRLAFMQDFVMRAEFVGLYPTTDTPTQYVNKIYSHALSRSPSATELANAVSVFGAAATASDPTARGQALLQVTQASDFISREITRTFVQMEYFGYLRRSPNAAPDTDFTGYNFWLNKLNLFNGDFLKAEMVKAFLASTEYRRRFGP